MYSLFFCCYGNDTMSKSNLTEGRVYLAWQFHRAVRQSITAGVAWQQVKGARGLLITFVSTHRKQGGRAQEVWQHHKPAKPTPIDTFSSKALLAKGLLVPATIPPATWIYEGHFLYKLLQRSFFPSKVPITVSSLCIYLLNQKGVPVKPQTLHDTKYSIQGAWGSGSSTDLAGPHRLQQES